MNNGSFVLVFPLDSNKIPLPRICISFIRWCQLYTCTLPYRFAVRGCCILRDFPEHTMYVHLYGFAMEIRKLWIWRSIPSVSNYIFSYPMCFDWSLRIFTWMFVTKESVLGPLLFLVCTNDLVDNLKSQLTQLLSVSHSVFNEDLLKLQLVTTIQYQWRSLETTTSHHNTISMKISWNYN